MTAILDYMNYVYICFHMAVKEITSRTGNTEITEEDLPFYYHVFFNKLNSVFKTYGNIIICNEGKDSLSWRREIFPEYKRNRDKTKNENNYKIFKNTFSVIEKVLESYPTKIIKVEGAEADDCIFAISIYLANKGEDVTVLSSDGDLKQIMNHADSVRIYNPVRNKFSEKNDLIVEEKAIVGDASDNIPGISRVGIKTFEKMMNDRKLFNEKINGDNKILYEKFKKIVDLSRFPKEKHEDAIKQLEKNWNDFDIQSIEHFYFENKLQDHLLRWGKESSEIMETLVKNGNSNIKMFNEDYSVKSENSSSKLVNEAELNDVLKEFF